MSVISPWIFYAISLLNRLSKALIVLLVVIVIGFCLYCDNVMNMYSDISLFFHERKKTIRKWFIACIICALGTVAIPSEETMYKMLVAKYVTYENVDKASKTIKEGVDYIFKKLDKE